ncbi:MAG TPA: LysR substrate-binding domain-containing protein [Paenirhodobacter sp.]
MRNVDLGWVRVFVEVGRCGSLSEAAGLLHITQPAVSYQIRRAEQEFATPLFRRLHRGVALTEAGQQLFAILSRDVEQIDRLAERLRHGPAKTVLRLFTDYAFSGLWLIPRIQGFRDAWPDLDLQIIATQRTDPAQLQAGDLAVIFGRQEDLGPQAVPLLPEAVMPVCAPSFAMDCSLVALTQAPLIHLDSAHPAPWFAWSDYFAAFGQERDQRADRGDLRFNTYSLVIDAAVAGQGIALGWRGLVDRLVQRGQLVATGPDLAVRDRGYYMVRGSAGADATDCLQDWLLSECPPPR